MKRFTPKAMALAVAILLLNMTAYATVYDVTFRNSTSTAIDIVPGSNRCISTLMPKFPIFMSGNIDTPTFHFVVDEAPFFECNPRLNGRRGHVNITVTIPRHSQAMKAKLYFRPFTAGPGGRHVLAKAVLKVTRSAPSFEFELLQPDGSDTKDTTLFINIKPKTFD